MNGGLIVIFVYCRLENIFVTVTIRLLYPLIQ